MKLLNELLVFIGVMLVYLTVLDWLVVSQLADSGLPDSNWVHDLFLEVRRL